MKELPELHRRTLKDLQALVDRVAEVAHFPHRIKVGWMPILLGERIPIPNTLDPWNVAMSSEDPPEIFFGGMAFFFPDMELCSIIAHEVGHLENPEWHGPQGELQADAFGAKLGYRDSSLAALQRADSVYSKLGMDMNEGGGSHPGANVRIRALLEMGTGEKAA